MVVGPPERGGGATLEARDLDAKLGAALGRASLRDAVAAVAAETGLARKRVYARALELAGGSPGEPQGGAPGEGDEGPGR